MCQCVVCCQLWLGLAHGAWIWRGMCVWLPGVDPHTFGPAGPSRLPPLAFPLVFRLLRLFPSFLQSGTKNSSVLAGVEPAGGVWPPHGGACLHAGLYE
jgi:hypothetical protein